MTQSSSQASGACKVKEDDFKEHLLLRRLSRVPRKEIIDYWSDLIEFEKRITQKKALELLLTERSIQKNEKFRNRFKIFLRDFVLPAKEADYLISIRRPDRILDWITSWEKSTFLGQKFKFEFHTFLTFPEAFLELKPQKYPFPSLTIFIVASSLKVKHELNGLDVIDYHPTFELEIIIRQDIDIVEIRGSYQVAQDFVNTAILDQDNPLSAAKSYFLGDVLDSKRGIVNASRRIIGIDKLKEYLHGSYSSFTSGYNGTKVSKIKLTLDDLKDIEEETEPHAKAFVEHGIKNMLKGSISFDYKGKKYSFEVTRTGGLFFRKFLPEEVVTYIIGVIRYT